MDELRPKMPNPEQPHVQPSTEELYSGQPVVQGLAGEELNSPTSHEATGKKPEKGKIGLKTKVGVGIAAAALILGGGSVAAKKAMNQSHPQTTGPVPTNPSPSPSAKASVEASPSPSANSAETTPTIETIEISSNLIAQPETLVETFIDERVTEWYNAGATPENAKAAVLSSTETIDEFAARVAAKYDKEFIDALLVKDWQSNPRIVKWVSDMIVIHRQTLALYFYTSFPDQNPQDKQPYERSVKHLSIESVKGQTSKSVTIVSTEEDFDNADLNRVGEALTAGKKVGDEIAKGSRTFVLEDNHVKLSDLQFLELVN
ncbi:MAG: hypothetical protein NTV39_00105 [Candidatus Saccharibacteria bacterium]|nr:hypothetical protein [Candidatus Saccharibacteria bacterium]